MTTISAAGILYIRQNGANIEYSSSSTFSPVTVVTAWPVTVTNTTPTSYLKVYFTTDITLTGGVDRYFICGSDYIQFGNTTLNTNGTRPIITIQNITNYPGLIQNGTNSANGKNYIVIVNLNIISAGTTTLVGGGGWVGQSYYSYSTINNLIVNCSSNGIISGNGGGIIGENCSANQGYLEIIGCNSSGDINAYGGGIIGYGAGGTMVGDPLGVVIARLCFSTGNTTGRAVGLIFSELAAQNCQAISCYSIGSIGTISTNDQCGGIFGPNCQGCNAINCYSVGNINSSNGGGIFGRDCDNSTASNCYSIGDIYLNNTGGIYGRFSSGVSDGAINCYTDGQLIISSGSGGIYQGIRVNSSPNYSEGNNGTPGWKDINAAATLQGVGTIWGSIASNTPYILLNFGISPYRLDVIDPTTYALNQTFSQTVQAGQTTIPAQVAGFKTFQILSGGHPSITIANTGIITTTAATPPGTYTLSIYAVDDYTTTIFNLTVTGAPSPSPVTVPTASVIPCCQGPICVQASPTTNKDNELVTEYTSGQVIISNVDKYYTDIKTGTRTFFVKPVFGSYREYMNYLQTKNRYV
jgi:hypothetical protein